MKWEKEIAEIPVLSDVPRRLGVPLSVCVRAGGFIFVSGLLPVDLSTGALVQGEIAVQTEQVMANIKHTLENVGMVRRRDVAEMPEQKEVN